MARVLGLESKPATTTPQLQHYMLQQSLCKDLVQRLCSKRLNVIATTHEDADKDEVTGRVFKAVALTGKLAQRIPGYFNEFWHTEIIQSSGSEPKYQVRTRSDQIFSARTTFKSLSSLEDQANIWPKILKERATGPIA